MTCRDRLIAAMPGTQAQLAQRARCSIKTVSVEVGALVLAQLEAHIGGWHRQARGGKPIATYIAGPGTNVPRPPITRGALYSKRSRVRSLSVHSGSPSLNTPPQEHPEEQDTAMNEICLTADEIVDITGRVRPAAQARHLKRMLGLDCQRRADGSLLVGREAAMRAITARAKATGDAQGVPVQKEPGGEASNGLNWSKRA